MVIKVGKNEKIKTINYAIQHINGPATIELVDDFYNEKVVVYKDNLTFIGNGRTTISFNDFYSKLDDKRCELLTVRTHTVIVKADNVTFKNLTIENRAGRSYDAHQAVALHLYGNNLTFDNCIIKGSQDTLFSGPLPKDLQKRYEALLDEDERIYTKDAKHYFNNCTIIGDIDFIFGGGEDYFNNCTIFCLDNNDNPSYICAPSHEEEYGMTFNKCKIIGDAKKESVYLARPWREKGNVTFIDCYMDDIINPLGFDDWGKDHNKIRFNEINSIGPGSDKKNRVKWINKKA